MPTLVSLALRYIWRHRRLSGVVLAVGALTTSLLAALPMYATVIAMRSLRSRLETASAGERNLVVLASRSFQPNPALMGDLLAPIEDLVVDRLDIRIGRLATEAPLLWKAALRSGNCAWPPYPGCGSG